MSQDKPLTNRQIDAALHHGSKCGHPGNKVAYLSRGEAVRAIQEGAHLALGGYVEPVGYANPADLVNDGYGHVFSVHSSEPMVGPKYVPIYARPVAPPDTVLRSDFDLKANEVEKAKALVTEIYHSLPEGHATRLMIERRTGAWFALGLNRDAE